MGKDNKKQFDQAVSKEIPEELSDLIKALPKDKQSEAGHIIARKIEMGSFSSPLPPPEILQKYNQLIAGSAERILRMAEEGQRADNSARDKVIDGQSRLHKYNFISQIAWLLFFLTVILAVLAAGVMLIFRDYREEGRVLLGAGGLGALLLAALSVYFRHSRQANKHNKK